MAIRALVNNNNFPDGGTAIVNGTLPWFNKPVQLSGKSNYNTVAITGTQGGKLWCYTSTGLALPPLSFTFRGQDYTDGVSPSSVIGFYANVFGAGSNSTTVFSLGNATMTIAELGFGASGGAGYVVVIVDRTVPGTQCTFLVNGVFKARKLANVPWGGTSYIQLSVDTTKTGSQGDFSNIYFIDDTQDDTQCTFIDQARSLHQYLDAPSPNGWVGTGGRGLAGVSSTYMDTVPAYTTPTFNSPAVSAKLDIPFNAPFLQYAKVYAIDTSVHAWRREAGTVGKQEMSMGETVTKMKDLEFVGTGLTYSMNSGPHNKAPDGTSWNREKLATIKFSITPT